MGKEILLFYSQDDAHWKDQAKKQIDVLITAAGYDLHLDPWDESRLDNAGKWRKQLDDSFDIATAVIIFVSKAFLKSPIMAYEKFRNRLKDKQEGGFPIFLVQVNKCGWKRFVWMKSLPLFPAGGQLIVDLNSTTVAAEFVELANKIAVAAGFENRVSEGVLGYLELNGVGPAKRLSFEPAARLNIITGDNGLGKTFLMECAWWALTGIWPQYEAAPREDAEKDDAKISFQLKAKSGAVGTLKTVSYDWEKRRWPMEKESTLDTGLVIYARVDGSFAVWDPVKSEITPPVGASRPLSPLIFNKLDVYEGIEEKIPDSFDRKLCGGLFTDWVNWQNKPQDSPFPVFVKILEELSGSIRESLEPAEPVSDVKNDRLIPALQYPYGTVPLIHAASSVQRIISLAYVLLWTWEGHKAACDDSRRNTFKNMTVLIDEVESHLHPQWQRSILRSLLEIKNYLDERLNIQFIISTHSPLFLASLEPVFEADQDKLFHLDIDARRVLLEEQTFLRHGRVDHWFTSETIGMGQARSLEAEQAIEEAEELQQKATPDKEEVKTMHFRLAELLGDFDSFWPRWTYFAEQNGVEDDSCTEETETEEL